jgi:hypothetical protein
LTVVPVGRLESAQALQGTARTIFPMEMPVQTTEERCGRKPDRKRCSRLFGGRVNECCARRMQQTCTSTALTHADGDTYVFHRRFVNIAAPDIDSIRRH